MTAYYFKIVEYNNLTCLTGGIVMEGIVRDEWDSITPQNDTGIVDLPHNTTIKDFSHPDYKLIGYYFTMTEDLCERRKLN